MYELNKELFFPPVTQANQDGIVTIGGDLSPERLLLAYKSGIFPWFEEGEPITWWSPNPRMVLFLEELIVSKSMRNVLNQNRFKVTFNENFRAVITTCQRIKRNNQNGTWITNEMIEAYCELNKLGHAKSVEVWQNKELVGGLYGVDLKTVFCGESMFSLVSNASKVAFITLVKQLKSKDYQVLDCQMYTKHLESLGCRKIDRIEFIKLLKKQSF